MMSRLPNCLLTLCWRSVAIIVSICTCHAATLTSAQEAPQPSEHWVTGEKLRHRLSSSIDVTWIDTPLRPAISRLEQSFQTAFFLDRRIDPDLKVSFSSKVKNFSEFIDTFSRQHHLHPFWVGPVVYVGRDENTECGSVRLDVQAEFVAKKLTRKMARNWQRAKSLRWPNLTEPSQLIDKIAKDARIEINNKERIPHDLWPSEDLPSLSLVNRLGILLLGFDLSFNINDDGSITIVPINPDETVSLDYPLSAGLSKSMDQLKAELNGAAIKINAAGCSLTGTLEQHVRLRRWMKTNQQHDHRPLPENDLAESYTVYTLKIQQQPFQPVIESLARKLDLTTEWDATISDAKRMQRVSFQVQNATRHKLLETAISAAGFRFRIDENSLMIFNLDD